MEFRISADRYPGFASVWSDRGQSLLFSERPLLAVQLRPRAAPRATAGLALSSPSQAGHSRSGPPRNRSPWPRECGSADSQLGSPASGRSCQGRGGGVARLGRSPLPLTWTEAEAPPGARAALAEAGGFRHPGEKEARRAPGVAMPGAPGQRPGAETPWPPPDAESEPPRETRPWFPDPGPPPPWARAPQPPPRAEGEQRWSPRPGDQHTAAPGPPPFPAPPPPLLRLSAARGAQRTHLPSPPHRPTRLRTRPAARAPTCAAGADASDDGKTAPASRSAALPPPPRLALSNPSSRRLSFSARSRRGRSGEGSELDPPRPRRGWGRRADRAGACAERAGRSRARAPTGRARAGPERSGRRGLPRARPRQRRFCRAEPNCRRGPAAAARAYSRSPSALRAWEGGAAPGQTRGRGRVGGPTGGGPRRSPATRASTVKSAVVSVASAPPPHL